jgi:hypothetical protein
MSSLTAVVSSSKAAVIQNALLLLTTAMSSLTVCEFLRLLRETLAEAILEIVADKHCSADTCVSVCTFVPVKQVLLYQ